MTGGEADGAASDDGGVLGAVRRLTGRAALGGLGLIAKVSPVPLALLIRQVFAVDGGRKAAALLAVAPEGVTVTRDVAYGTHPHEVLDLYRPAGAGDEPRPVVVWVHGGAFVGGAKEELEGFLRFVVEAGVVAVAPRYALAPGSRYPTPVRQVLAAIGHVVAEADRFGVDPTRIVVAGDSAGAQIAAQVAALVGDPARATAEGFDLPIVADQLRGAVLCCGVYDLGGFPEGGPMEPFLATVGWAYSGTRDFRRDEAFVAATSVARHVGPGFPESFVTVGNADPLRPQTTALLAALADAGVAVEAVLFADDHEPPLGHEYQFDASLDDAHVAIAAITAFIARVTAPTA